MKVRLLLSRFYGDESETPTVVAAIDQTIWEHWEDSDEEAWRAAGKRAWGMDPSDCEWAEVWVMVSGMDLARAFVVPIVFGVTEPVEDDA